ncbi:MAG: sugar ABC transporter substrate-binding protein [Nocardiopsaceae bacterium]|nr:sugar ABC transporter substrate-binding protein [Nocardiopsaceae bacterium]
MRARRTARYLFAAAVTAAVLAIAACGSEPSGGGSSGQNLVIGSVVNDMTNPYLATMAKAEQAAAAKYGMTIHVLSGNANGSISISQQVSDIEQLISQHVSLILVTPSDPKAIVPAITQANEAGIPVIAVNTNVDKGAKVVTFVGANDYAYGVAEGRLTAKALNGKGNVALLLGVLGDSPEVLRTEGIKSVLAKYPHIHILSSQTDNWINSQCISDVQDLLSKDRGSLDAVVAEGPEIYAGAEYAASHGGGDIKFIAGDYSKEVEAALKKKVLYGTVDQDPGQQGTLGVQYAHDWLTGHKSEVPRPQKYTPLPLITQSNVDRYHATWSS